MNDFKSLTNNEVEILIAEDSLTQAQRLQHLLEQQGYRVIHAANGKLALAAAKARKPTLIISDVVMPEMNGYELCCRVKDDPVLYDTPVILVTALSDSEDVIRGLECRADNFILKPYDESYLLNRIQFVLLNREMHRVEQASIALEIYFNGRRHTITANRLQILNLLLSTYDAAIQRNRELARAQEDLRQLNDQLQAANKELESFSYSVSHDLRAPLRHIHGYVELLQDATAGQLTERAQRYLLNIREATVEMGQLIDDLLGFSRMSRTELLQGHTSLDQIVENNIRSLDMATKDRKITWKVASLPCVTGDSAMLNQVFANLLGNAVKFTRGRDEAVIEVGLAGEEDGKIVVFVRDNGAGFDSRYAHRLFGVFQRLHTASEFEGTGIGLATVHRILARHGERIWAKGAVDEGATFYFTLKPSS